MPKRPGTKKIFPVTWTGSNHQHEKGEKTKSVKFVAAKGREQGYAENAKVRKFPKEG